MDNETDNIPDNVSSEAPVNAGAQPVSVGAMLREARERLGLSVDDVVSRIKFAPRQIEALEADDFAQLPEMAFVRGFVRSYARLLQLDTATLLAALPYASAQSAPMSEKTLTEVPLPGVYSVRRHNIIWLAAALVVALALAFFTLLNGSGSKTQNSPAASQIKVETLALPPMVVLTDSAEPSASSSGASAVPVQAPVALEGSPQASNPQEGKASVELSAPKVRVDPSAVPARGAPVGAPLLRVDPSAVKAVQKETGVLAGSAGILRMVFDDDSWVEVTDKDGKRLTSQINPSGSELNLDGNPPFSLVIGRAASVHLYYKGQKIDLAPHTNVSTARLTLE